MSTTIKIFLASSKELAPERNAFEIFINRKNKALNAKGVFLELNMWEDYIDVMSKTRLQDEYNKAIKECHLFVMLFWNKVGIYTEEEFETAFHQFQETNKPFILTYFKNAESEAKKDENLISFQNRLRSLGHFATVFPSSEWLTAHFNAQLEKLNDAGFLKFIRQDKLIEQQADKIFKPVNEFLTKELIEAIKPYSKSAQIFLENVKRRDATKRDASWETNPEIRNKAQEIIYYSFVGVLGIQLRKLLAIGKANYSESNQATYVTNCVLTLKRVLQLLCFTLMSKLWDHKKENKFSLQETQANILKQFFDDLFEPDIDGYFNLMTTLMTIFRDFKLATPITELNELFEKPELENKFRQACVSLKEIGELADKNELDPLICFDAEKHLTEILKCLAFLANYKMISIKDITYDEMRNNPPRYIHKYVSLGFDNKLKVNAEKVNYVDTTVNTEVILLYKERYQNNINLFPFIIDINALTFEGGVKICFYSCKDISDDSLNYSFLEDSSILNIGFTNTVKSAADINDLIIDKEKRKLLKLDNAYSLFQEAKKNILEG